MGCSLRRGKRSIGASTRGRTRPATDRSRHGRRYRQGNHAGSNRPHKEAENVEIWERTFAIDLLTTDGVCRGELVWQAARHGKTMVWAKQTILATGGAGQVYRETTNPEVATGDGMAMAYRAGADSETWSSCSFIPRCYISPAVPQPDKRDCAGRRGPAGGSLWPRS